MVKEETKKAERKAAMGKPIRIEASRAMPCGEIQLVPGDLIGEVRLVSGVDGVRFLGRALVDGLATDVYPKE